MIEGTLSHLDHHSRAPALHAATARPHPTWSARKSIAGDGIVSNVPVKSKGASSQPTLASAGSSGSIIGNSNSHVYHLSTDCPGYAQVAPKNQVIFDSESDAQAAGYRKAGNCK